MVVAVVDDLEFIVVMTPFFWNRPADGTVERGIRHNGSIFSG